jgi:hypothetical protein
MRESARKQVSWFFCIWPLPVCLVLCRSTGGHEYESCTGTTIELFAHGEVSRSCLNGRMIRSQMTASAFDMLSVKDTYMVIGDPLPAE